MSLSNVDVGTLEALRQFKAFFEMVQNPKQFAEIVKQADETLARMQAVVEAHTTVELANEYLTKAKAFANEKTEEIAQKEAAFNERVAKALANADMQKQEAQKASSLAAQHFKDAEDFQKQLQTTQAALNSERASLAIRADELYKKEVQLQDKEKDLNQKAAKLKELLG